MKPIPLDRSNTVEIMPEPHHTAAAMGNPGVEVVGTPALIGYLEVASHQAILPFCEAGEATVGTRVEVDHLAPAFLGTPVTAAARVVAVDGRRVTFAVEARQGERVVMTGRHGRAVVDLARLLGRYGKT
jgi:predicted thioesterase